MRELRHDFRRIYHVAYDAVPTDEAIDLIKTLPDGSAYVSATDLGRSWGAERHRHADLLDAIRELTWALAIDHEAIPEPPTVMRPKDVLARMEAAARREEVSKRLKEAEWEEM